MAESRSLMVADWPRIDVPPEMLILVLDLSVGDEDLDSSESEIKAPAADGGSFDGEALIEWAPTMVGSCIASGFACNASVFESSTSLRGRVCPDI